MIKKTSDYAGDIVSGSFHPGLNNIWTAIKATGGKILWDTQLMTIKNSVTMTDGNPDMVFEGDGSNQIILASSAAATAFNIGGFPNFELCRLMFTGEGTEGSGAPTDAQAVFTLSNVLRAHIHDCRFLGIKGTKIFDILTGNSVTFRNCQMSGNSADVIKVAGAKSIVIEDCDFIDYAYNASSPGTYSKSPDGAGWVRIASPPSGVLGAETTSVKILNCRFDEASNGAIKITGYNNVKIEQCKVNIQGTGIELDTVKDAVISFCHFGYNHPDSAVIKVINSQNVTVIGCKKDSAFADPHRIEVDSASIATFKKINCPDLTVTNI